MKIKLTHKDLEMIIRTHLDEKTAVLITSKAQLEFYTRDEHTYSDTLLKEVWVEVETY